MLFRKSLFRRTRRQFHHLFQLLPPKLTPAFQRFRFLFILLVIFYFLQPFSSRNTPAHLHQAISSAVVNTTHGRSVVVVTAVNFAFRDYALNLICSMRRAGISTPPLIFALDSATAIWAKQLSFPVVRIDNEDHSTEAVFGSKSFNLLSKRKLKAVSLVLKLGMDVLFVDADIVWCRNIVDTISKMVYEKQQIPHLMFQTAWPRSLLNSGLYYARSDSQTIQLFDAFLGYDSDAENDQVIVNRVLCRTRFGGMVMMEGNETSNSKKIMPIGCRWRNVQAMLLPPKLFPTGGELINGRKLFHNSRKEIVQMCSNGQVLVLHNNCILSVKKKPRFITKGIWYVNEEMNECNETPMEASIEMRKRCGASKCGPEGDIAHFPNLTVR